MKYTSSEILKMAQTYLVELGNNFDHYKIRKAVFDEEDELIRGQDKGKKSPLDMLNK